MAELEHEVHRAQAVAQFVCLSVIVAITAGEGRSLKALAQANQRARSQH